MPYIFKKYKTKSIKNLIKHTANNQMIYQLVAKKTWSDTVSFFK